MHPKDTWIFNSGNPLRKSLRTQKSGGTISSMKRFTPPLFFSISFAVLLIVGAVFFVNTASVSAQPLEGTVTGGYTAGGLVPCNGIECEACHIVSLLQNVINFLLGLSIPIAIALFAWAGVLYFTSAEKPGNITKARSIFSHVLIGFVIALSGYLIVNTILHAIVTDEYADGWNKIKCVGPGNRPMDATIGQLLGQAQINYTQGNAAQGAAGISPVGVGFCSPNSLNMFGSAAAGMSCILQNESSCNPLAAGDNGFSIGLAQINMTANNVVCNGQTYNCPKAFSARYTCKNGVCTTVKIINPALEAQCRAALQNTTCNLQTAQTLYNQSGFGPWTTRTKCGL